MTAHLTVQQRALARRLRARSMSLRDIAREIGCSHSGIDVLYHFSLSSVARMGRAAVGDSATAERNATLIDAAIGEVAWRNEFEMANGPGAATLVALAVARRFGESMFRSTGIRSTAVEVRQRPLQLPKYLLMLFSGDAQAHWDFADQASNGPCGLAVPL